MGTLYVDQSGTELRMRDATLQLRRDGQLLRSVPAGLLTRIVLRADTIVTSNTLAALAQAGIGLVAFGGRSGQRVAHILGTPMRDVRTRVAQCQRLDDPETTGPWCTILIRGKVRAQRRMLQSALQHRPDLRLSLSKALNSLQAILEQTRAVQQRETLRGLEGAAAAAYFRAYAQLFAPSLGFEGRRRRPPPDPVNASLSLGYTLLYSQAVQACWTAGLDPMIGLLHQPAYGRASMACDLMEPWRPAIDAWVWQQFRQRALRAEHFGHDGSGACLLGKAGRAHFYAAITPLQKRLGRALQHAARRSARWLAQRAQMPAEDPLPTEEDPV